MLVTTLPPVDGRLAVVAALGFGDARPSVVWVDVRGRRILSARGPAATLGAAVARAVEVCG